MSITEILPRSKVDGLYVSITQHVTPDVITARRGGAGNTFAEREREREREIREWKRCDNGNRKVGMENLILKMLG